MNIKNKKRVAEFGEVFTNENEVNQILDLVTDETKRIDSRFFEPACGNGNFLAEVLLRKLEVIKKNYLQVKLDFERYTFLAVCNLYGVDIQMDNVNDCRERLYKIVNDYYLEYFANEISDDYLRVIKFVLTKNIMWGDALNLKTPDKKKPIVFSEWSFIKGSIVKRKEFLLSSILDHAEINSTPLFSDAGEDVFVPKASKEFEPCHFYDLGNEK